MYLKNKKSESFYQSLLELCTGASHKTLQCGVTDVSTDEFHAEIKQWDCYKEGVGQLMCYNSEDPKGEIRLYMFGSYSPKAKRKAHNVCENLNIQVYEFVHKEGVVDIVNFATQEIVWCTKTHRIW